MPQVQQVIRFTHEEIKTILIEKAKTDFSESGGKLVQGKTTCDFTKGNGDDQVVIGGINACITFERAGK